VADTPQSESPLSTQPAQSRSGWPSARSAILACQSARIPSNAERPGGIPRVSMPDRPSLSLDPAELLAQRAWMRRFAAALAGAEGEDLVQDAWVRVLTARDPALARPRAWLASVLRNAARMRNRGAVRRDRDDRRVRVQSWTSSPTTRRQSRTSRAPTSAAQTFLRRRSGTSSERSPRFAASRGGSRSPRGSPGRA
jgi:hypothetical protein